ncbi:RING-type domain-containing protein [Meloidogyne graminicola]|uniref:RING-type domain-containing protein n=1 Tax=Meloidogyne graminicola TaxID=189291 RepID=A0A8S9ZET0_9BILA|nr:RING-type domain-containing protein [Meloidogyne graminicola]
MSSFVKWVIKGIHSIAVNEESRRKCAEIEDAEKIRIDSSPLHCPVCLSVFFKSPEILPCGHSFCVRCIDAVRRSCVQLNRETREPPFKNTFECPLCRFNVPINAKKTRNFALEAILDSLEVYDVENAELAVNDNISTLQFVNKRLKAENQEQQRSIVELTEKLENANNKIKGKVTLLVIGYILLTGFVLREVWNYFGF